MIRQHDGIRHFPRGHSVVNSGPPPNSQPIYRPPAATPPTQALVDAGPLALAHAAAGNIAAVRSGLKASMFGFRELDHEEQDLLLDVEEMVFADGSAAELEDEPTIACEYEPELDACFYGADSWPQADELCW